MGRLIDADALIEAMDKRYNEKKDIVPNNLAEGFMQMEKLIKEQPTAYDMEKVVAELEDKYNDIPYQHEMNYKDGCADGLLKAIDIVRKGGVE